MNFESTSLERDLAKVRQLSSIVRKRILESNPNYERKIDNLTQEELEDFDSILTLAEQLVLKHHHKKEAYLLLKEFADMMKNWTMSIGEVNDQIQELLISAKSSVSEIKSAQSDVSSNLSFGDKPSQNQGTINLTKPATGVYTQEYQGKSPVQYEQVV
ncbi:MAG: hypothetical protein ACT4OD_07615 [Candidatus Nitrosotenuis sp.]